MARRRWVLSGGLLVISGAITALSTWRHWVGCRSERLSGACQVLHEELYRLPFWADPGHRDTLGSALTATSALLLSVIWVVVVGWVRPSPARTAMAVIVGLQPLLVAAFLIEGELTAPGRSLWVGASGWPMWPAEILVFPFLLGAGWLLDTRFVETLRLILLGWAVTSFGSIHYFADYVLSRLVVPGSESAPSGMGYVTAISQIALGVVVVFLSAIVGDRDEPEEGEDPGRSGFRLAA